MKIAITGKPDVGKTTIIRIIECEFPKKVIAGGDALSGINKSFFPQPKTEISQRCYQKALYHLQFELEKAIVHDEPNKLLLCDHGSLDLIALWPGSPENFFLELNTTLQQELDRYDFVIQINGIENKYVSKAFSAKHNPKELWKLHSRFFEIPSQKGFSFSYIECAKIIKGILSGCSITELREALAVASQQTVKSGFLNL